MAGDEELDVDIPDKLFFRIGEAATIVGVEAHVLRYWESEFKMRPTRSPSGQRMYRRKDLAKLFRIKQLLHNEGFTIAGARKALSGKSTGPGDVEEGAPVAAADASRVGEAQDRIRDLRRRVQAARARFSTVGVATGGTDG